MFDHDDEDDWDEDDELYEEDSDFETVIITQRFTGYKPFILIELEEGGGIGLEAGGGSQAEMIKLSKQLNRLGKEMRKQYKIRQKENN